MCRNCQGVQSLPLCLLSCHVNSLGPWQQTFKAYTMPNSTEEFQFMALGQLCPPRRNISADDRHLEKSLPHMKPALKNHYGLQPLHCRSQTSL